MARGAKPSCPAVRPPLLPRTRFHAVRRSAASFPGLGLLRFLRPIQGYAAGGRRGLLASDISRSKRCPHVVAWMWTTPQPISVGSKLAACRMPSHLTVLTRPGVVRAAYHPSFSCQDSGWPQLLSTRCDGPGRVRHVWAYALGSSVRGPLSRHATCVQVSGSVRRCPKFWQKACAQRKAPRLHRLGPGMLTSSYSHELGALSARESVHAS